jgi:intracellular multiplication protein IcmO
MSDEPRGLRGLSNEKEVSTEQLNRDIRRPMEVIGDAIADNPLLAQVLVGLLILPVFFSTTFFVTVCFPILLWVSGTAIGKRQTLPMLLPTEAGVTDRNDPKPGRFGYNDSSGDFLIGNKRFSNKKWELWLSFSHLLQHTLVLGSTGAGKTETLVSMAANYLAQGSGVFYSDAKAAPSLGWQIFTLARAFGREDDFRVLNYIKGNTSEVKDPAVRRSNNVNLFAYGSAESVTQIIISIMPPGGQENKLFSERAIGLISSVMPALIDLRDRVGLLITPAVIRKSLERPEVEKLHKHPSITRQSREAIRAYLASLPGYNPDPGKNRDGSPKKQPEEVGRQFGFAQAYFTRALSSLSDTYGDIYMTGRGEINFLDMLKRRRTGVCMVPALELAPDEMKNLSKIVLAAQKNAISTGIPPNIEGRKADVLESLPITAPVPYGIINDEFAFMMVAGYAVTLAQARSLFTAITIAGQDYAGMAREDEGEAEQIIENTKTKIIMASEGVGKTAELVKQIAGEGMAATASGYARDEHSMSMSYTDSKSANFERRSRVDTMDTRAQVEGEALIFWRDKIVPVAMFYHGIDPKSTIDQFTIPRLLNVDVPTRGYGARLSQPSSPYRSAIEKALKSGAQPSKEDLQVPPTIRPLANAGKYVGSAAQKRNFSARDYERGLYGGVLTGFDKSLDEYIDPDKPLVQDAPPAPKTPHKVKPPVETDEKGKKGRSGGSMGSPHITPVVDPTDDVQIPSETTDTEDTTDWSQYVTDEDRLAAEEEAYMEQQYGDSDDDTSVENRQRRIAAELSGIADSRAKNLVSGAMWTLDPTLLCQRVNRSYTEEEETLALDAAQNAMRIERATGTGQTDAENVGMATAGAVLKSIDYPRNRASIPQQPKTDEERKKRIDRTTDLFSDWLNASEEQDDSMGQA